MVEFLTIFLGLVAGEQPVALEVDGPVAAVELRLDGRPVAELTAPPWRTELDFGQELLPHELEAVALDAGGEELARASQHLNLPRSPAEVSFLWRRDERGRAESVGLAWESRTAGEPREIRVTVDGRPLDVSDPERIPLPGDQGALHLLEAELEFARGVVARAQAAFGGDFRDATASRLTAVPIELEGGAAPVDEAARALAERLRVGEEAPRVVAVEAGPAEVVFVRGRGVAEALAELPGSPGRGQASRLAGARSVLQRRQFAAASLAPEQFLRVLYPATGEVAGRRTTFHPFPVTPAMGPEAGGVFWNLLQAPELSRVGGRERLADAVAAAGNQAATGNRRRAVVVALSAASRDEASGFSLANSRRYLEALRVPLRVWYFGRAKRAPNAWRPLTAIESFAALERAVEALSADLERQRIVWIEGFHLPQTVRLAEPP